ncbi:hypothetical protein KY347_01500 [Candidatus Woesearchaeota archaeon]|nr:hypothetical protein [Candidatus Woesearchaeota archaeon]
MYEIIGEGNAAIKIKRSNKVSKEMEVFYNPVMKLNRDISILLLNSLGKKGMQISLPLAGSGIRGIRLLKELDKNKIKSLSFNDYSQKALNSIVNNLELNKIRKFTIIKNTNNSNNKKITNKNGNKIKIFNEDANLFLLKSSGFDYIDIDPFGTSNPYLDSAVKRISREGILAVTNTDTAALSGTYPKACIRKYWALPKKDYMMHETGLRILIRKVQLIGMQYEKALLPIFSYSRDHYFRVFFQCIKGKKTADDIARQQGMFNDAGPLWLGSLWDVKLANKMHSTLIKNSVYKSNKSLKISSIKGNKKIKDNCISNNNQNYNELLKFLKIIKEESKTGCIGFYDVHDIAEKKGYGKIMKKERIIEKIKGMGFKAANTHFSGTGIRSDVPCNKLLELLKE